MPERLASPDQPLALTVHAMPTPDSVVSEDARRTRSGRWKMLVLALVCAAPVVASYFSYYVIRPDARRNYGVLIEPQRPMPTVQATDLSGQPVDLATLKGQWLLVSVGGAACDAGCENHLYLQRQLRESLGKEKDRLDWVWLVTDQARVPDALRPALAQATVIRMPQADVAAWLQPEGAHQLNEHLYVIDPMGHWMMRFPADMDRAGAARAKRDLERLLRASAGWDQPGRAP